MVFYEYALDPELLTNWKDFRYFSEKFGWSYGRLISRYPKRWKRLVYDSLLGCTDIERKRIEEGLKRLDDRMVKRPGSQYDKKKKWLKNAIAEHKKKAFRAIIACENPGGHDYVLIGNDVEDSTPFFQVARNIIPRKAEEFVSSLALLIQSSRRIVFVDPHFKPNENRFRNVLARFLKCAFDSDRRGGNTKFELHTSIKRFFGENTPIDEEESRVIQNFVGEIRKHLPPLIPINNSLQVCIWKQKDGGEKIHNRYVLTDRWGVGLPTGLDESADSDSQTDDIYRLTYDQYLTRWAQYTGENPAFERVWEGCMFGVTDGNLNDLKG
ncbi:MAG: hypothetical protein J7M30_08480 [Deltaproteobacteria bacterium]|nr:hypothetical protein [Deltaproteobacteria bacterium]